jgi:Ser/Thr protein kinase RdoA (MazF antagonist)
MVKNLSVDFWRQLRYRTYIVRQILPDRLLSLYGLNQAKLLDTETGYRNRVYSLTNAGDRLALIVYKSEPDILQKINNAHYTARHLDDRGLPVRAQADPRIALLKGKKLTYAALYEYLPGTTIPWEAYTMAHIKQLGAAMSDMHAALKELDRGGLSSVTDEYKAICEHMRKYFQQDGVKTALERKLHLSAPLNFQKYDKLLDALAKVKDQQALHMDFVRSNILFSEDKEATITGILDFEKTAWGHPVFDIARTLAFLIVDCKYKDEAKVRKYFLHSGYNKRGQANFNSWKLLEPLVDLFLLYDFYKFLRHNPYEYLEQNEHFVRTSNFLLNRNVLSTAKVLK